jgi:S1-C subfamily serine protease
VIWSADGLIVTAHHVVQREEKIQVGLSDGKTVKATLVGRDPTTDLALLRADAGDLSPSTWADPEALGVGHLVLALGRPGKTVQATLGVVSALGGEWRTHSGGRVDHYLQTDVVMYPGFSGGPLVGAGGHVLGINTSALLRGTSLAVPTPTVRRVADELLSHGQVRRGYLGVGVQPARLPEGLARQLGQETGVLLVSVEPGGPAEKAGLFMGDTLVALDNQPVRHHEELLAALSGDKIGQAVPMRILRGGQIQEVEVVVGAR